MDEQTMNFYEQAESDLAKHYNRSERVDNVQAIIDGARVYEELVAEFPNLEIAKPEFNVAFKVYDELVSGFIVPQHAAGSCYMGDHGVKTKNAVINISNFEYESYDSEMYECVIRHELAHAECNLRYGSATYSDGDFIFNEIVEQFDGTKDLRHTVKMSVENNYESTLDTLAEINNMDTETLIDKALNQ